MKTQELLNFVLIHILGGGYKMEKRAFSIIFDKTSVDIDTDKFYGHNHPNAFLYSNMKNLYTTGHGHGLQTNNRATEQALMRMCDKISQAIYEFQKETEE